MMPASSPIKAAPSALPDFSFLSGVVRLVRSKQAMSWLDQGLVSATSFLCLLVVARWAGAAELGAFAFGISMLAVMSAIQEALVVRPYNIRLHRADVATAQRTSDAFWLAFGLAGVVTGVLLAAFAVGSWAGLPSYMLNVLLALSFASPCVLLREFARKTAYAHLRIPSAVLVSAPASALTLAALAILAVNGTLTAANAIAAMGLASAVSAVVWHIRNGVMRAPRLAGAWRDSWDLGKWFLAAQAAVQAQAYAAPWVTIAIAGASLAGIFAACASLVAISNPLLFGFLNLLIPQSSRVLHEGGVTALRQKTAIATLQIGAIMGAFCLALALSGDWLMSLLYPLEYQSQGRIYAILAVAAWAGALGVPAAVALSAAERAGVVAMVIGATAVLNLTLVVVLLPSAGLIGAAWATLVAEAVGSAACWATFLALVRSGSQAPALKAAAANREAGNVVTGNAILSGRDDELPGAILQRVIATLEAEGVRTCILHGYQRLPAQVPADVDCVVSTDPGLVIQLINRNAERIGARVVRRQGSFVVLAARRSDTLPAFLCLDLMRDCAVDDLVIYRGAEVLAARRRFGAFWIPSASMAFAAYLARSLYKSRFDDARIQALEELYREDPAGAGAQMRRLWHPETSDFLARAIKNGQWDQLRPRDAALRSEMIRSAFKRAPLDFLRGRAGSAMRRLFRIFKPGGVAVVLLGPDGAGKSSTIDALGRVLEPAFARHEVRGFAPALSRLVNKKPRDTSDPHGLPARSMATSLLRAAYWLAYSLYSHLSLRVARARSTLVLYDRHFSDILIDPRRYRYGGPRWALRLNAWLMPRPDLVLMLDAPAEVLQARKQEVPLAETARQLGSYRELVKGLRNGQIVDAACPRERVTAQAAWIVLDWQAARQV